jgi:2'-5' RNA ligase
MRLFVAIELSDEARAAVAAEQKKIVSALSGSRLTLVRPEHLHLTLAFLGEVPEERATPIVGAMTADVPCAPYRLDLAGVGAFPDRGAPRALWVGVGAGRQETIELRRHVVERLRGAGVTLDERFDPHLTLGRWRKSRPSDRPRGVRVGKLAGLMVEHVTLFQSRLSSSGPTYERLADARLRCP